MTGSVRIALDVTLDLERLEGVPLIIEAVFEDLDLKRRILAEVEGISFTWFTASDVVRHPMVQHIVEAYDREVRDSDDD